MDVSCEIVSLEDIENDGAWVPTESPPLPHAPSLRIFSLETMKENRVSFLIGQINTGKTDVVYDILRRWQDIPCGIVVSGGYHRNEYSRIVPPVFLYEEYSSDLMVRFARRQHAIDQKMKEEGPMNTIDPRGFLVLDDCLYDSKWIRHRVIHSLLQNSRLLNTTFLITMQWAIGIPPRLRACADYVFVFRENITSNRRKIYEQYLGDRMTFAMFNAIMNVIRDDREYSTCLVIDNTVRRTRLEDFLFLYKFNYDKSVADFRMCGSKFWEGVPPAEEEKGPEDHGEKKKYTLNVYRG